MVNVLQALDLLQMYIRHPNIPSKSIQLWKMTILTRVWKFLSSSIDMFSKAGWVGVRQGAGAGVKNFPVDWQIIKQHLNSWYVGDGVFADVEGRGRRECEFDYYFTSSSFIIKWNPDIFSLCTLGIFINIYLIKGCLWAVSLTVEGDELLAGNGRKGTISVRAHLSAGVDPD